MLIRQAPPPTDVDLAMAGELYSNQLPQLGKYPSAAGNPDCGCEESWIERNWLVVVLGIVIIGLGAWWYFVGRKQMGRST